MAKISKYEQMVGSVVDGVLVSDYRKTQKESLKTGRSYYKYEVELENIVWVSTTAFNRKTYGRKLDKARQFSTKPKNSKPKQTKVKEEPRYEVALIPSKPITADLLERDIERLQNTLHYKEFKKVFRELAGKYHPDKGGNTVVFGLIKEIYDFQGSVLKDVEDAVKFIIEEENGNEEDYKEMMKCSIYLHTTMYDLRASIHGEQRGISKYYQKWSHIKMEDIFAKETKQDKPKETKVKETETKPSQEPVKEEPKPSQDKPKDKVKNKPKQTKTKTKQEQILEEDYNYYFDYYKDFYTSQVVYSIKGLCEEHYRNNKKKPSVKAAVKKVYNLYREPHTDFTAKTKFTNEKRRNENKACNDAWESLEITDEKIKDILETQWLLAITDRLMKGALDGKEYAKQRYEFLVDMLEDGDSFISYNGCRRYKDAEEYFNFWNDIVLDKARNPYKDLDEDMRWQMENDDYCISLDTTFLEEWLTVWQDKFRQAVYELWSKVEEHFKKFEEEWYKENFGSSKAKKGFNKFDNEFGKLKDAREIKKLYRKLSKVNHPDLGGDEKEFIQLKEAYDRAMARVA